MSRKEPEITDGHNAKGAIAQTASYSHCLFPNSFILKSIYKKSYADIFFHLDKGSIRLCTHNSRSQLYLYKCVQNYALPYYIHLYLQLQTIKI